MRKPKNASSFLKPKGEKHSSEFMTITPTAHDRKQLLWVAPPFPLSLPYLSKREIQKYLQWWWELHPIERNPRSEIKREIKGKKHWERPISQFFQRRSRYMTRGGLRTWKQEQQQKGQTLVSFRISVLSEVTHSFKFVYNFRHSGHKAKSRGLISQGTHLSN